MDRRGRKGEKGNGEGDEIMPRKVYRVKCPKCGIKISPDDKTENAYTILKSVMKGDRLEKIILQCNRCKSQIHLTGFHLLNIR